MKSVIGSSKIQILGNFEIFKKVAEKISDLSQFIGHQYFDDFSDIPPVWYSKFCSYWQNITDEN